MRQVRIQRFNQTRQSRHTVSCKLPKSPNFYGNNTQTQNNVSGFTKNNACLLQPAYIKCKISAHLNHLSLQCRANISTLSVHEINFKTLQLLANGCKSLDCQFRSVFLCLSNENLSIEKCPL